MNLVSFALRRPSSLLIAVVNSIPARTWRRPRRRQSPVDRARAFMPTGTVPPFVMRFDAGGVPVGDLVFSSKTKTVAELQDAALFGVRPLFAILPGVSAPRSSQRTILVRLDRGKLRSYNMSPDEVVRASLAAGKWSGPPETSVSAICGLRYRSIPLSGISKASTTFRSARREHRRFSSATSDRSKTVPTFRPVTRSSTFAAP